jgi:hypothetical protein
MWALTRSSARMGQIDSFTKSAVVESFYGYTTFMRASRRSPDRPRYRSDHSIGPWSNRRTRQCRLQISRSGQIASMFHTTIGTSGRVDVRTRGMAINPLSGWCSRRQPEVAPTKQGRGGMRMKRDGTLVCRGRQRLRSSHASGRHVHPGSCGHLSYVRDQERRHRGLLGKQRL